MKHVIMSHGRKLRSTLEMLPSTGVEEEHQQILASYDGLADADASEGSYNACSWCSEDCGCLVDHRGWCTQNAEYILFCHYCTAEYIEYIRYHSLVDHIQ
ncbi:Protein of unknown function [Pyronema omphalodes CBS 100304]|uniref:Uncharacterized protein n=1 Tax=Pyronema omphalodes (strain CBS 100304) TaxID=1076935 RepID=U4LWF2_PYROM|nr:Protein of unknown function [Pyronema omphalodes CBS 100304]